MAFLSKTPASCRTGGGRFSLASSEHKLARYKARFDASICLSACSAAKRASRSALVALINVRDN
jgi:hypothetical protein